MPQQKNNTLTEHQQLEMLVDFGKEIANQTQLDDLLALIAKRISQIIGAEHCFIFIKDAKRREFWSKIARGRGLKYTEVHLPINGKSVAALVAKTGQTINMPDAYEDPRFSKEVDLVTGFKTSSLLAVPLTNQTGNVIGVFELNNKQGSTPFTKKDEGILKLLATLASGNIEIATLYEDVKLSNLETIYRLAITAEYRDQSDTRVHLMNISRVSYLIAKDMGFSEQEAQTIKDASMLHDIGKVAIPDNILLKPGKLTEEEFSKMKTHTFFGGKILEGAKSNLLRMAHKMSLFHHEKYNGNGYPFGLTGSKIPAEARIVAVADVFDALCMTRVYKKAWAFQDAVNFITEHSGSDFDPEVVDSFTKMLPQIKPLYQAQKK